MRNIEQAMEKIPHDNVSDIVVQTIKNYILDNQMTSGDKLPTETQLSSVLGISRPSIREAMKTLEGCGIISTIHGKGRYIRDFNFDQMVDTLSYNLRVHFKDFYDVVEVRTGLETFFLPLAASKYNDEDLEELTKILDTLEQEINEGKTNIALVDTHTAFHRRLYRVIDNKLLDSLISMFATFQRLLSGKEFGKNTDNREFLMKHRRLLEALRTKSPERIIEALDGHFSDFESLKTI